MKEELEQLEASIRDSENSLSRAQSVLNECKSILDSLVKPDTVEEDIELALESIEEEKQRVESEIIEILNNEHFKSE